MTCVQRDLLVVVRGCGAGAVPGASIERIRLRRFLGPGVGPVLISVNGWSGELVYYE